jgi:hypothetical protein
MLAGYSAGRSSVVPVNLTGTWALSAVSDLARSYVQEADCTGRHLFGGWHFGRIDGACTGCSGRDLADRGLQPRLGRRDRDDQPRLNTSQKHEGWPQAKPEGDFFPRMPGRGSSSLHQKRTPSARGPQENRIRQFQAIVLCAFSAWPVVGRTHQLAA